MRISTRSINKVATDSKTNMILNLCLQETKKTKKQPKGVQMHSQKVTKNKEINEACETAQHHKHEDFDKTLEAFLL